MRGAEAQCSVCTLCQQASDMKKTSIIRIKEKAKKPKGQKASKRGFGQK